MPLREYSCAAPRRPRPVLTCILFTLLLALALLLIPRALSLPYPLVWFALGLISLTAGMLLSTRYLSRHYVYRIVATQDGGFDFVVTEQFGRRLLCVCRVSLDELTAFKQEKKGHRERVDHDLSLAFCRPAHILTVDDGGGTFFERGRTVRLRIEPDATMAAMLDYHLHSRLLHES